MIKSLLGREVPAGGIPLDIGVVVNNVGTLAAIGRLLPLGEGMTERVITVTGPGVEKPGNYTVPLGTTIGFVLEQVGYSGGENEFVLGGPMMGPSVYDLETPVTKGTSGLLVLNEPQIQQETRRIWPCIKCGRCYAACEDTSHQAIKMSEDRVFEIIDEECVACNLCIDVCPVEGCITMEELVPGAIDARTGQPVSAEYGNWTTHPNNPMAVKAAE